MAVKTKQILIRVTEQMADWLSAAAAEQNVTVSALIRSTMLPVVKPPEPPPAPEPPAAPAPPPAPARGPGRPPGTRNKAKRTNKPLNLYALMLTVDPPAFDRDIVIQCHSDHCARTWAQQTFGAHVRTPGIADLPLEFIPHASARVVTVHGVEDVEGWE